jgi:glutamine synthetase
MEPVLTLDQLRTEITNERVDTVVLAFTDLQGRLQGERIVGQRFLDAAGDFDLDPDFSTLRHVPWHEKTALCLAEPRSGASPRQVLRTQLERLAERGLEAFAGTELEFLVFKDTYEEASEKGYKDLRPARGTEKLIGRLRRDMTVAGLAVERSTGNAISFGSRPALRAADELVVFTHGAREIAALEDRSITFMAKYDEREGSACRLDVSLRGLDDAGFERVLAGQLACLRELTLFYAPHVNSYKRFGSAPGVVGRRESQRLELRLPGADANPYLALAAMIAAGLHGLEREPAVDGAPPVPTTLREAAELFHGSQVAREAFGEEVVVHYLEHARAELEAFEAAVTDWERVRGFE